MSKAALPRLIRFLTGPGLQTTRRRMAEARRVRRKQAHRVTVYLRLNDPYSYLLVQVLDELADRYPLEYEFRTVLNLQQHMYPAPSLWEKNARVDGVYLAGLYHLRFPRNPPGSTRLRDISLTAQLLHWELQPGYLHNARRLFDAYWQDDANALIELVDPVIADHAECYRHHLQANEALLEQSGHYLSAMLHYGGEWYWGLDRLEHLERRLNSMGLNRSADARVRFNRGYQDFCKQLVDNPPGAVGDGAEGQTLQLYWSIRSPYSYIGLVRARQLAAHYGVQLQVKPVLPMVMRRMQVPRTKGLYILQDARREADKYGIDFGLVADPLGAGVERCYALLAFAQRQHRGLDYLESYARGVWAEGIRSDTDAGLRRLVERAGLDWDQAREHLQNDSWRLWAQQNLSDLYAQDLWGVPSMVYAGKRFFGQDRVDAVERLILAERADPVNNANSSPDG
jgi:2-hydroxychromene-2-carboxylate isomerase